MMRSRRATTPASLRKEYMDDPKKRYPDAPINQKRDDEPTSMAAVLAQMAQMQHETARLLLEMKQSGTGDANVIEQLLEQQQQLLVKTKPENTDHPGISAFSYPEGDLKKPKPDLKCEFIWCGQEESKEQLTPEEIELRNRLEPGNYFVTKANGQKIKFNVAAKYTDGGKLESLNVWFPCKGDQRNDHMSSVAYLRQVLGEQVLSLEELMAQVNKLQGELASARSAQPVG
jgi:hypothetical protein